ncbi:glycosyltransferase family 2 protein [Escherichia coli]|nr:glycosyltransferase family 2 protein [Escherichia coli]
MFLTVVIPLYNKSQSIESTIKSVLNQTHTDFELIVVNDGSTDGSENVIKQFTDERIKLLNITNSGVSVARNTGIRSAKSSYVCLLDADDYWLPNHLEKINNLVERYPDCSMYSSCFYEILEDGSKFQAKNRYPSDYIGILDDFFLEYSRSRSLVNSSCVCLNKKMFAECGGFPVGVKLGEDIYLWLKMAMLGQVAYSGSPQVIIRRNAENRTATRVDNDILYHIKYFHENPSEKNKLPTKMHHSLDVFLKKNIFVNALFTLSIKDEITFNKYLMAMREISCMYYIILGSLSFVLTPYMLKLLRKIRNLLQNS